MVAETLKEAEVLVKARIVGCHTVTKEAKDQVKARKAKARAKANELWSQLSFRVVTIKLLQDNLSVSITTLLAVQQLHLGADVLVECTCVASVRERIIHSRLAQRND